MSFDAESFFTGKKSKSEKSKPYDWMSEATKPPKKGGGKQKDWMDEAISGGSGLSNIGIDIMGGSSKKSGSKKSNKSELEESIEGLSNAGRGIKNAAKMFRKRKADELPRNHKEIIDKAKQLEEKEKTAKKYEEAKQKIADYEQRRQEFEAAHKKESHEQTSGILSKLRNLRKNNNPNPKHLEPL